MKSKIYTELQNFFLDTPFVLFGTGTSCALDTRFGMGALQQYLENEFSTLSGVMLEEWQAVLDKLNNGIDFENSMNEVNSTELINRIVENTANFVASIDKEYSTQILDGKVSWSLRKIINKLFNSIGENQVLNVATPNYDLLCEYSLVSDNIAYCTGFSGGVIKHLDWEKSCNHHQHITPSTGRRPPRKALKKHIKFYKPHGSLNTFLYKDKVVESDIWTHSKPFTVERILITPGLSKYEKLHEHRTSLLSAYDAAVNGSSSFLFLGFGFNDMQLVNGTIKNKIQNNKNNALVITRDLNERIEEWMNSSENMWVICKQDSNDNARVFNKKLGSWYELDINLWEFSVFSKEILGT